MSLNFVQSFHVLGPDYKFPQGNTKHLFQQKWLAWYLPWLVLSKPGDEVSVSLVDSFPHVALEELSTSFDSTINSLEECFGYSSKIQGQNIT